MATITPEALVKGRVAEYLVELLFTEAGYKVVRIAYEGLLVNISREETVLNKSRAAGRLTTAPSFAVFDARGREVGLVKVKFKAESASGRNISYGMGKLAEYWPEAQLVVVTTIPPFFKVVDLDGTAYPIESLYPRIKKTALRGFSTLVNKFLGN